MTKRTPFQKFEALAQQLVEGTFHRLFRDGLTLSEIAAALAKFAEDEKVAKKVPARYELSLNPANFDAIRQDEPNGVAYLTEKLNAFVKQEGYVFSGDLFLTVVADPAMPLNSLQISTLSEERPSDHSITQIRQNVPSADALAADIATIDAYLIVDGQRHVPLTKSVTSLGRSVDNDVVLDAPTVSRQHAQIRWRYGRFILYDVSNRGRTLVNNQAVSETVLQSGDVISLSNVMLIYGEGENEQRPRPRPASPVNDETQIRPPQTK